MDNKTAGFTLIEMLIGIVIGMIVVAAASVMMVSVLKSQKDVTASARLNQELGAAMAVISNEIRRAGFSVCDENVSTLDCENFVPYKLGEDIKISDVPVTTPPITAGCILYRYNANVDDNANNLKEQRGFRLFLKPKDPTNPNDKDRGVIQMAKPDGEVKCDDTHDFNDPTSNKWENLTNLDVIDIDFTSSSFSTTGSKCRNMTKYNPANIAEYWIVEDKPTAGDTQTGLACDNGAGSASPGATTPVDYCTVIEDPTDPSKTIKTCSSDSGSSKTVDTSIVNTEDELFGTRQIIITLDARLTRDQTVTKILKTSVKVANPQIEIAP